MKRDVRRPSTGHGTYKLGSDIKLKLGRHKPESVWYARDIGLPLSRPVTSRIDAVAHAYKDSEAL